MEQLSFESITTSKPVMFRVGPNAREFYLHSTLVTSLSKIINASINGSFGEAATGVLAWPDVDEATFARFAQFAYTGSYYVQETPSVRTPDEADPPADPTTRAADEDDFWSQPRRPKVKVTRGPAEPSYYGDLDGHFLAVFAKAFDKKLLSVVVPEEVRPTQDDSIGLGYDSYADIFLAHARLFVFADCYDINRLAGKALNAFHRALARSGGKVTDVVPLVEYCIETDIPDALRDVVLTYLTSKAKVLWSESSFRELLERSHNMSLDLLDTIFRELGTSKT